MAEKSKGKSKRKGPAASQLPARAIELIKELNFWETTYGETAGRGVKGYKVPGEAKARIAALRAELDRLNVAIKWDGTLYQFDAGQKSTEVSSIQENGPPVMTDEERKKSCCDLVSFEVEPETDKYIDKDGESHKRIKFKFKVKKGADPKKCVLVNWEKGFFKNGDGTYFRETQQGNAGTPINYPKWQVDTVDTDPIYWSQPGSRWNYVSEGDDTYSATDDPGPALSTEHGAEYAMQFRMCIYCIDDVPEKKTDHVITSKAIKCIDWEYSVKVGKDGTFTHPKL